MMRRRRSPSHADPRGKYVPPAGTDPNKRGDLNCAEAKDQASCLEAWPPADGCMDKRGSGHSGDTRMWYNYGTFISDQCAYYAKKGGCKNFAALCEKSCGLCPTP